MGCGSSKSSNVDDSTKHSSPKANDTSTLPVETSDHDRTQTTETTDDTDGRKQEKAEPETCSEPTPVVEQSNEEAYSAPPPPPPEPEVETTKETEVEPFEKEEAKTETEEKHETVVNNTKSETDLAETDLTNQPVNDTTTTEPIPAEPVPETELVVETETENIPKDIEDTPADIKNDPADAENHQTEAGDEPTEPENYPAENQNEPTETENHPTESQNELTETENPPDVTENKPEEVTEVENSTEVPNTENQNGHSSEFDEFQIAMLKSHNECRMKHGVPELILNKDLSAAAQAYAETLITSETAENSPMESRLHDGADVGENVTRSEAVITGEEATLKFYNNIEEYNYEDPAYADNTCDFTQMIWKSSQQLGVGRAASEDGAGMVVVCRYFPVGNVEGEYADNVPFAL